MSIVPRRDYFVLLVGDIFVFTASLWLTLAIRSLSVPSWETYWLHLAPFLLLFVAWAFVFFLAGLYDRHTRLLRSHLPETILYAQVVNVALAALFFFLIPWFGIAPKTILVIYLLISSGLIYGWRVHVFPHLRPLRRFEVVLIGSGPDMHELVEELEADDRYPFSFADVIDTDAASLPEVVQRLCRITGAHARTSVIIADTSNPTMAQVLPIVYDVAFREREITFLDLSEFYQEIFQRVPLSSLRYDWVLAHLRHSLWYDTSRRALDILIGLAGCAIVALLYPLVALALKIQDGGSVFIRQERIGRYQQPFTMLKFRSMSGNDAGKYTNGKTQLVVTRVGKILRRTHLDEFPQFWNLLKGDLTFVGPRPELPALVAHYAGRIPFYHARHLIKPGLTGWARVRHRGDPHHGTDVDETKRKLAYDLYYLRHRSFLFDLYITFQTIKFLLIGSGK